jgi:hypothetical protein
VSLWQNQPRANTKETQCIRWPASGNMSNPYCTSMAAVSCFIAADNRLLLSDPCFPVARLCEGEAAVVRESSGSEQHDAQVKHGRSARLPSPRHAKGTRSVQTSISGNQTSCNVAGAPRIQRWVCDQSEGSGV